MEEGTSMMTRDGWWPGSAFVGDDERLDFECANGHRVPYTVGQMARGESVVCPECGAHHSNQVDRPG